MNRVVDDFMLDVNVHRSRNVASGVVHGNEVEVLASSKQFRPGSALFLGPSADVWQPGAMAIVLSRPEISGHGARRAILPAHGLLRWRVAPVKIGNGVVASAATYATVR